MTPKAFVTFTLITAVVTAAAFVTVARQYWNTPAVASVRPFPGLLDKVNDVAEVTIQTHGGTTTLRRDKKGWQMVERSGYPVRAKLVRKMVVGISEMKLTERKTRMPTRYARLDLEDITAKGSKAKLVTFKDAAGKDMAQIMIGRSRAARLGGGSGGVYVRLPGKAQTWLATTNIEIPNNPVAWLKPRIIYVNPQRISGVTTVQPNGETLVLYKEAPKDKRFIFKDLPEGTILKGKDVANGMAQVLMAIDLADVAPESKIDFGSAKVAHAKVRTFDGLVVKVDLLDKKGKTWARFHAAAEPPATPVTGKDLHTPEQVKAEAAEIDARTRGWAYALQEWQAGRFRIRLADFLEAERPPPPPQD